MPASFHQTNQSIVICLLYIFFFVFCCHLKISIRAKHSSTLDWKKNRIIIFVQYVKHKEVFHFQIFLSTFLHHFPYCSILLVFYTVFFFFCCLFLVSFSFIFLASLFAAYHFKPNFRKTSTNKKTKKKILISKKKKIIQNL